MPHFLIQVLDRPDAGNARQALRAKHIDYWLELGAAVKAGGAILEADAPVGSFLLLEAPSAADARKMITDDPFTSGGVFADKIQVSAVRPAIGAWLPAA